MNLRPRRVEEPDINLVSLIDVVLMIVIFFMLSSTFNEEGRLKIRLPEAGAVAAVRGEAQSPTRCSSMPDCFINSARRATTSFSSLKLGMP